ncbi:MAG: hypothetical protein JO173_00335 [Gammaproteobacteria bacterium]|nr:hypothetical protein [Gammaproteobacteria bacterium]
MSRFMALACLAFSATAGQSALAADGPLRDDLFPDVSWRLVGPYRGGWSTMAVGVPAQPLTYYAATAGGGVWKTEDAGRTWAPITDNAPIAAVGALAVAPSDASVLYVGTGHPEPRYDITAGHGVFRSRDGGRTWIQAGLADSRHIGALLVDPRDPNRVLAAALGHVFGPSEARGVFRTADGGTSWTRTLGVDDRTGAVDLAADPKNPDVVYATSWTAHVWPWLSYFTPVEGPGSAIWRSADGGRSWQRLGGAGWPAGPLGRIGIAVTHKGGNTRIYACVASEKSGGLYRSDDDGGHWTKVHRLTWGTSWYASRLTVSPSNPDTLYSVGQSIHESRDGGRTWTIVRGAPGGDDFHYLWINPTDPSKRVAASDQGAIVSENGGATWSAWYNQPTGQFYYLAADDRFPYWIYSGQQDSGTVAIASRSDYGAIGIRDWHPVGGDERDYDLPDPEDPGIVFASGLGGRLSRWSGRTGEVQNVAPWPSTGYGKRATDYRYHYTWFSPIAFSRQAPYALYAGAQVLFRSMDRGTTWEVVSPDLSRRDPRQRECGGDPGQVRAAACGFGVVNTIAPSARDPGELWVGTDDGLIWLSRDNARTWRNVTPATVAVWTKVSSIDYGPAAGVMYAALDGHRQDDFTPHVIKTADYGGHWTDVTGDLPHGEYVSVVRADPVRAGLLYAGTSLGALVSFDDGAHWQPLAHNLPPVWVHDLLVKDRDLIAATVGRAIWVIDDLSPLRTVQREPQGHAQLYPPADAWRLRANQNKDTPPTQETPLGRNPPTGAVIDYWVAPGTSEPVTLEIHDSSGRLVHRAASDVKDEPPPVEPYFAAEWLAKPRHPSAAPGAHRYVWDLHLPRPRAIAPEYSISASVAEGSPLTPMGPLAVPGTYNVTLLAGGERHEARLTVLADPRVHASAADYAAALAFGDALGAKLERAWRGFAEVAAVRGQLAARVARLGEAKDGVLARDLRAFDKALEPIAKAEGDRTPGLKAASAVLVLMANDVEGADRTPTLAQREAAGAASAAVDQRVAAWEALQRDALRTINAKLGARGLAPLDVPDAAHLKAPEPDEGDDLP